MYTLKGYALRHEGVTVSGGKLPQFLLVDSHDDVSNL
jgi:hypothetical protein